MSFLQSRFPIGIWIFLLCSLPLARAVTNMPVERRVLTDQELISQLQADVAQHRTMIDELNARLSAQQIEISNLKAKYSMGPNVQFNHGAIAKSGWQSLPGEALIQYTLGGRDLYFHKSRFEKLPNGALIPWRKADGSEAGGVNKETFNRLPGDAMIKFYMVASDPN